MSFGIKPGYRVHEKPLYFVDDDEALRGVVYQPDVYAMAELLGGLIERDSGPAGTYPCNVVDIGCGWAGKLAAIYDRHPWWGFTGVDYGENIEHCRATYDWGNWIDLDIETARGYALGFDIVICSDVIEHLIDPHALVRELSTVGLFVLSTPERDVQYGVDHRGPSSNYAHVREWNTAELHDYLTSAGIEIVWHGLTRGSDQGWAMGTQLLIGRGTP